MEKIIPHISFKVHSGLYLKDPDSSDLGKKIVSTGLDLIHDLGLEQFTFGKLSKQLGSPESTIYRYFENKHKFLLYLLSIYWLWLEYCVIASTSNVESPTEKLQKAVSVLASIPDEDIHIGSLNAHILAEVASVESTKAYLTKEVDAENSVGIFRVYKRLVNRIAEMVLNVNPVFKYPHTLVSTLIEGAHLQHFYAQHIPQLCDFNNNCEQNNFFVDLVTTYTTYYEASN